MEAELAKEFGAALDRVPFDDTGPLGEWLSRRGLTAERRRAAGGLGVTRAQVDRKAQLWEPLDGGERVLVVPVWDGPACDPGNSYFHPNAVVDLVAWLPIDPTTLFLRTGDGVILGVGGLEQALDTASRIRVFKSVEAFIREGGEVSGPWPACVILNSAFVWARLHETVGIITDDLEHGEELERLLADQRPPLPQIFVNIEEARAA